VEAKTMVETCEISSSHGGEYDVQSCLLGYNPEDSSEHQWLKLLPRPEVFLLFFIMGNKVGDSGFKIFTSGFKNINLSTASLKHKDK
jgi:hypothetical protein